MKRRLWLAALACGACFSLPNHLHYACDAGACPGAQLCVNGLYCCDPTDPGDCPAQADAGALDGGGLDGGGLDAGPAPVDAGRSDAAVADASAPDAGSPSVCFVGLPWQWTLATPPTSAVDFGGGTAMIGGNGQIDEITTQHLQRFNTVTGTWLTSASLADAGGSGLLRTTAIRVDQDAGLIYVGGYPGALVSLPANSPVQPSLAYLGGPTPLGLCGGLVVPVLGVGVTASNQGQTIRHPGTLSWSFQTISAGPLTSCAWDSVNAFYLATGSRSFWEIDMSGIAIGNQAVDSSVSQAASFNAVWLDPSTGSGLTVGSGGLGGVIAERHGATWYAPAPLAGDTCLLQAEMAALAAVDGRSGEALLAGDGVAVLARYDGGLWQYEDVSAGLPPLCNAKGVFAPADGGFWVTCGWGDAGLWELH